MESSSKSRYRPRWAVLGVGLTAAVLSSGAARSAPESARATTSVLEVHMPRLAWNTNAARFSLHNEGTEPRSVWITIRSESLIGGGALEWTTEHVLAPDRETVIEREFMIKPLPGGYKVRVAIAAGDESRTIFSGEYLVDFPISNDRINSLSPTPLRDTASYPRLVRKEHGPFSFYFVEGSTFIEGRLEGLALRRELAYRRLAERINPAFDGRIAFFLFPDAETKEAHTFHRGEGWSVGNMAIVEILDATHELDPYHELAHVVVGSLGTPPAMLDEGVATFSQEGEVWLGHTIDAWSRAFKDHGMLLPLPELLAFGDIGSPETCPLVSYPQSGSVVKFLVGLRGWPAMQRALRELRSGDEPSIVLENRRRFVAIFGLELAEAERQWLVALESADVETVPRSRLAEIECDPAPSP